MEVQAGPTVSSKEADKKRSPIYLEPPDFFEWFIIIAVVLGAAFVLHMAAGELTRVTFPTEYERQSTWVRGVPWIAILFLLLLGLIVPWEKGAVNPIWAIWIHWYPPKTQNPRAQRLIAFGSLLVTTGGVCYLLSRLGLPSIAMGSALAAPGIFLFGGGSMLATRKKS
jgi:hypothetical protein